jgi:general L-amino acid transport system substrate-binding protein
VRFTPLTAKERFTALQSGEVDILSRNTTWTMSRDTALGLKFAGVTYYDGQGFMVKKDLGVNECQRTRRRLGVHPDRHHHRTEPRRLLPFQQHGIQVVAFENNDEVIAAYDAGAATCSPPTQSGLYADRLKLANPDEHIVLPEIISKEPLGPVVRQGDDQWFNVVKWTYLRC